MTNPSTLDEIMDIDPLSLSDQQIEAIIAYQRQHRANAEKGVKAKKYDGPKLSLDSILKVMATPAAPIKRRF